MNIAIVHGIKCHNMYQKMRLHLLHNIIRMLNKNKNQVAGMHRCIRLFIITKNMKKHILKNAEPSFGKLQFIVNLTWW